MPLPTLEVMLPAPATLTFTVPAPSEVARMPSATPVMFAVERASTVTVPPPLLRAQTPTLLEAPVLIAVTFVPAPRYTFTAPPPPVPVTLARIRDPLVPTFTVPVP